MRCDPRRGWDKLVAVLFHGSWTQASQHAVGILQSLASQRRQRSLQEAEVSGARQEEGGNTLVGVDIILAEADVMSLIDVADRQAIELLPSLHLHLGGREIVRFRVYDGETAESLGARIADVADRVRRAGRA